MFPGVNFLNILRTPFLQIVLCAAFLCLELGIVIFWQKNIGAKAAHNMLMKLNTNILGLI
jgi:hypothetical protein